MSVKRSNGSASHIFARELASVNVEDFSKYLCSAVIDAPGDDIRGFIDI
jgi:hypothetical protein